MMKVFEQAQKLPRHREKRLQSMAFWYESNGSIACPSDENRETRILNLPPVVELLFQKLA